MGAWSPVLVYEDINTESPYGLLDKSMLLKIQKIEKEFTGGEEWPKICQAKGSENLDCRDDAWLSPLAVIQMLSL